jgi:predicted small lipoprotein YifL
MRKSQLVALLILFTPIALTACGQKGALYLSADPDDQAAVVDAVATDAAATDAVATEEETKKEKSQGSD